MFREMQILVQVKAKIPREALFARPLETEKAILHRFESFMVALWYWSMLVQAGILVYCATLAFRQTVGIKERNLWIVIAAGMTLVVATYYITFNRVVFLNLLEHRWSYFPSGAIRSTHCFITNVLYKKIV
ncbi:MAG: GerAB/ArcD/ProY family transporter [Bacillota bacterium]